MSKYILQGSSVVLLQERHFASISRTDYKDTKESICGSEIIGITVAHDRCCWMGVKKRLHGNARRCCSAKINFNFWASNEHHA